MVTKGVVLAFGAVPALADDGVHAGRGSGRYLLFGATPPVPGLGSTGLPGVGPGTGGAGVAGAGTAAGGGGGGGGGGFSAAFAWRKTVCAARD